MVLLGFTCFYLAGLAQLARAWYVIGRLARLQTCWNTVVIATLWEKAKKRIKVIGSNPVSRLQLKKEVS